MFLGFPSGHREISTGGDKIRKIQGVKELISYLDSVNYSLAAEEIYEQMLIKKLPHKKLINNIIIFDLDQIDWWIEQNRAKK